MQDQSLEFNGKRVLTGVFTVSISVFFIPIICVCLQRPTNISTEMWTTLLLVAQFLVWLVSFWVIVRSIKSNSSGEVIGCGIFNDFIEEPYRTNPELMVGATTAKKGRNWLALLPVSVQLFCFGCFLIVTLLTTGQFNQYVKTGLSILSLTFAIPFMVDFVRMEILKEKIKHNNQLTMEKYDVHQLIALTTATPEIKTPALRELRNRGPLVPSDKLLLKNPSTLHSSPLEPKEFYKIENSGLKLILDVKNLKRFGLIALACSPLLSLIALQNRFLDDEKKAPMFPVVLIIFLLATCVNSMFLLTEHEIVKSRFRKTLLDATREDLDIILQQVGQRGKLEVLNEIERRL